MNLYAGFLDQARRSPQAVSFDLGDGRPLTREALHGRVATLAGALAEVGVGVGDRVLVQVEKSLEAVALYLACLSRGAVYTPLNTAYTGAELDYFLGDAEPRLLVCDPAAAEALATLPGRPADCALLTLDASGRGSLAEAATAAASTDQEPVPRADDDLAAILYTSGTTGRSKGAMLSHGNLASNAASLVQIWGFSADDVLLHALPIYHVHGLFVALHCALSSGAAVRWLSRFDAAEVCSLLPGASVYMGVPTHYVRLLGEAALDRACCAGMRLFVSGSAPLLPETFAAFEQRTGHRILERYGMTEAGMIASNPLDGERVPGTVGFALPDVALRLAAESSMATEGADEDADEISAGGDAVGVLEVRGPNVFAGYWRQPEKTRESFHGSPGQGGWFVTGDLASIDAEGRVSIVGRARDLIISGGLNVYPREVEAEIDALDGVVESAVIGVAHPDFGEAVVACVVLGQDGELRAEPWLDALRQRLAPFKLPKRFLAVPELPRNAMGKVQKQRLRERCATLFEPAGSGSDAVR